MTAQTLATLRDLSVILLVLEAMVFLAVPGVLLFFAQKYLRRFRHWLRLPLLRVQVYALRIENTTLRASNGIAGVPIAVQTLGTRVRTTFRRAVRRA